MLHEAPLLSTLAIGLSAAFIGGLVAAKLRLSPIVGYLLAGILIGPFTPGVIANAEIAAELSEIGIVLLMFGVGLHFSLRDLMVVRNIALPGAVGQIIVATLLGMWAANFWGWSLPGGILFGLALSVASTVVLLRALEEHNALHTLNGHIAVGWLIVEDLVMVLALVLIPALAPNMAMEPARDVVSDVVASVTDTATQKAAAESWIFALAEALGKIALFVSFMLVAGKRALPWLLHLVVRTRSRELFTLAVFAAAVGVAFGAAKLFGVSFALGAFFAGMMIKESTLSHEVAEKALPFQDAFAVLFFVAVGMLFNPAIVLERPLQVLLVVLIIMVGKSIAAFCIVLLFRYPVRTALMVSASLAQIGEFSFILAGLGLKYELLPEDGNSLILAGALISITLNPLMFHAVRGIHAYSARHRKLSRWLNVATNDLSHLESDERQSLRDLVILVGYGRVGRHIQQGVESAHMDLVVIDLNRERVEAMREAGIHAIAGDATHGETLEEAAIEKAQAIIVAVPNPFEARRIVEAARELKPHIRVLVRAQSDDELAYFQQQAVDLAVMGAQEVANRMVEYLNTGAASGKQ